MYDAGFKDIPVVSLSINGIEKNGIMKNVTLQLINRLFMSVIYGDLLMKVLYRVRPVSYTHLIFAIGTPITSPITI